MSHRGTPAAVRPWIEKLILNYGNPEKCVSNFVKAHVIGLGYMTESQALECEGPKEIVFLSDGHVRIPAVLTATAWTNLMEREERMYFNGLLNATMLIMEYQLKFHMHTELEKCWFFLSVGNMGTVATGPYRQPTPCHTTLSSVRMKTRQTWQACLVEENFVWSQSEGDLTQLLEAWQQDYVAEVVEDVREILMAADSPPGTPQSTTSAHRAPGSRLMTGWDVDRVRYKGEVGFTVPVKCLLIPEEVEASAGTGGAAQPATEGESSGVPEQDSPLHNLILADSDESPLSNPWDAFPPPCVSLSSSNSSTDMTQIVPEPGAAAGSDPDSVAMTTDTQLPVPSDLPPYQKQPIGFPSSSTTSISPPEPPTADKTPEQNLSTLTRPDEDNHQDHCRNPQKKRCKVTTEPGVPGPDEPSGSPPSWLFDLTETSIREEPSNPCTELGPRKVLDTHSDGKPFMYTYKVTGQNLQNLSQFRVPASLLHWAVKYLVPPRPKDPL